MAFVQAKRQSYEPPLPQHIAIIMDGNARWAHHRGQPAIRGHQKGAEVCKSIVKHALKVGIKYLTLYAFSSENWLRPKEWVAEMMDLMRHYLGNHSKDLIDQGVRIRILGDLEKMPKDILKMIQDLEAATSHQAKLDLFLALSYGARDEITSACRKVAQEVQEGRMKIEDITPSCLESHLYTRDCPNPDLLIRTSGEMRLSNFLLWQLAYSEFVFTETLWPDFSSQEFDRILEQYAQRDRRYGVKYGQ